MPLGTKVGLGPGNIVLDAEPAPPQGVQPPIFAACLLWQTAGWTKMALGMEVGLGQVHIALDGDTAPLPKMGQTPNFRPMFVVAKRVDG